MKVTTFIVASLYTSSVFAYNDNCEGSLFPANKNDCITIRDSLIQPDILYADGAYWNQGHCYITYATNASGPHPIKGEKIIEVVNTIMEKCSRKLHGSYGTGEEGCEECHVTLNYRA